MPIITMQTMINSIIRSSCPEVFLVKSILKICNRFTGGHLRRIMISVNLLCNFIEITLWHGCSPVNLPHISRTPFSRNTSGWLLLYYVPCTTSAYPFVIIQSCIINYLISIIIFVAFFNQSINQSFFLDLKFT